MSNVIPYDRISPNDFYKQLDTIHEQWYVLTEPEMTRQLQFIRSMVDRLPGRYYELARPLVAALGYCRLQRNSPYEARLVDLRDVIREWAGERELPPRTA